MSNPLKDRTPLGCLYSDWIAYLIEPSRRFSRFVAQVPQERWTSTARYFVTRALPGQWGRLCAASFPIRDGCRVANTYGRRGVVLDW